MSSSNEELKPEYAMAMSSSSPSSTNGSRVAAGAVSYEGGRDGVAAKAGGKNGDNLKQVVPQPGRPLYLTVRDAVRSAIDAGTFQPGQQMPSTKELSDAMKVSLVTMHRALQELVASGVLRRSQGKGTFVHQRYLDSDRKVSTCRVGLVLHREASLADYYHSQVLDGVRQAADQLAVDLILLRFGEDVRNECDGYLLLNPIAGVDEFDAMEGRKQPCAVVGARWTHRKICSIDVDNVDLARQATLHLIGMGHKNVAYVGGADEISNSADRWAGFSAVMRDQGLNIPSTHIVKGETWRLSEKERLALVRVLSAPNRPKAIFAAGYFFALDVYAAANMVGLRVPEQLSIIGIDDPPSAAYLSPPLTTMRQPLLQLGHAAVTALVDMIQKSPAESPMSRMLLSELVIRRSTAPPA